jgi:hypothetical protein
LQAYTFKIENKNVGNLDEMPRMERDGKNVIDETYKLNMVRIRLFK